MASGLTAEGFTKEPLQDTKTSLEEDLKTAFGKGMNLRPASNWGTVVGLFSDRFQRIWNLAEFVYFSQYRSKAEGTSLDGALELIGNKRLPETKSQTIGQLLFGTAGKTIPTGTVFSVDVNSNAKFSTDAPVTLVAGVDEVQHLNFSAIPDAGNWKLVWKNITAGLLAFDSDAAAVQATLNVIAGLEDLTVSGTYPDFDFNFSGAAGKQDQADLSATAVTLTNASNPVSLLFSTTTQGVPQGVVSCSALATGPTEAQAGSLTTIESPTDGLSATINPTDAVIGRGYEVDSAARIRSDQELQISGNTTVDAIRSKVLEVTGVLQSIVFENDSMITDINGIPPKSLAAYVDGGDEQEIADALWKAKGGGISYFGNISKNVIDSQGITRVVQFSRPTPVLVWVIINVTPGLSYPADGDAQVLAAVLAYGEALAQGDDVLVFPKLLPAVVDNVVGITDIQVLVGLVNPPTTSANIVVAVQARAKFDSSRIQVNS